MTYHYDLISEPWVPCVTDDGRMEELGLRDALVQAHRFRELGGESPLVSAALYRLLLAVVHRVFGPEGRDAWAELWARKCWDAAALDAYFARWRHRFDLFDEDRPFFQASYPGAKPKSIISLVHHMASGNNPVLFDHHTETDGASLSPAEAARALVAAQSFGLGGLSGFPEKFTDGSCARGVLFLVVGDTLFETLMLNMPYRSKEDDPLGLEKPDMPCWEMDDPLNLDGGRPYGLQDRYTWLNRRVRLLGPDIGPSGPRVREMTWGPGLRLDEKAVTQ
ncbi:MAG: type I-E CRISPR-associated protein Cse1/CasA, partial [Chloroflexi bacterium]|nr:type I-E CRISPR-associated protein Cse1/CasA [Chloroflexota bacterium]